MVAIVVLTMGRILIFFGASTLQDSAVEGQGASTPPSIVTSLIERAQAQLQTPQADSTDQAIELLHDTFELDPSNAKVEVALSFALTTRATEFRARNDDDTEAENMARNALQEDP